MHTLFISDSKIISPLPVFTSEGTIDVPSVCPPKSGFWVNSKAIQASLNNLLCEQVSMCWFTGHFLHRHMKIVIALVMEIVKINR